MSLSSPLALLLLLAPTSVWLAARRLHGPAPSRAERSWSVLLGAAPVLLVLALAGPKLQSGSARPTVLAVDESDSIDATGRALEGRWTAKLRDDGCASPCSVIRFAGSAGAGPLGGGLEGGATDLQSAIAAAIGLAPQGGRVAVVSDGGQTRGELLAAAAEARRRDVQVDWARLGGAGRRDAAITAIGAPPVVHRGDTVPLTLTVHSSVSALAELTVSTGNAKPAGQTIPLRAGDNPLLLLYTAADTGWQSFRATVSLPGDQVPANNSLAAVTDVVAAPRVLLVGARDETVPRLLAGDRMDLTRAQPSALPAGAAAYSGEDEVVLDDVSATQLGQAQVAALSSAVRSAGLGLTVLGGPHSFSLGRYAQSGLQALLPVSSLVPGNLQRRNLAVELVLDHSGSMSELAGGVEKIAMARAAARQSAAFLRTHQDALGAIDFDIKPHTLLPLQLLTSAAEERRVDSTVDGLQADGGTNIYLGLQAGLRQLLTSKAKQRHLILMTDGISQPANYGPLLTELRQANITVATVALGADANRSLLAEIAARTGGHAYVTDDARELPRIFVKETQLSAKPVRVTGRLPVRLAGDSSVVRSLIGKRLPPLAGNVVSTLKSGAQADLLADDGPSQSDPALAEWQIGAGRVVAFTPGLDSRWAGQWARQTALWNDAVRWSERGAAAPPLTPQPLGPTAGLLQIDLAGAGPAAFGVSAIEGTLTGNGERRRSISFAPAGPSLYQADVSSWPAGVYRFSLHTSGLPQQAASGEVAIGYPAELSPVTAQISPMGQLVAQTGGQTISAGDPQALESHRRSLQRILVLVALLIFLAGVAGRMLSSAAPTGSAAASRPAR